MWRLCPALSKGDKSGRKMKVFGNKIIQILIWSDVLIISGFGLISPIFAVFITQQIQGGNLEIVGLASTIYLLFRSVWQLFPARLIDKIRGERDDFLLMLTGTLIVSVVPLLYLFINRPLQLFLIQGLYGIGGALSYPAWLALFTRHVDKKKTAFTWGVYNVATDIGGAVTAGVGGFLANRLGFRPLFLVISAISFTGSFLLLIIGRDLKRQKGV